MNYFFFFFHGNYPSVPRECIHAAQEVTDAFIVFTDVFHISEVGRQYHLGSQGFNFSPWKFLGPQFVKGVGAITRQEISYIFSSNVGSVGYSGLIQPQLPTQTTDTLRILVYLRQKFVFSRG